MDLPQENAGKDSPTYTMGSVTPAKRLSFLQDWTGRNENNDTSLDGIVSNTTIREPDQHDLDMDEMDILGVPVPKMVVPLNPGKNITVIAEVVALNHLLKYMGVDSAALFNQRLMRHLGEAAEYLAEDYE